MGHTRAVIGGVVLVALATAGLVACDTTPAFCTAVPSGADAYEWTGATNDLWTEATNWDTGDVPGLGPDSADDYACIATESVRVGTPEQGVKISLLAIDSRGTLTVTKGNKLFLGGSIDATKVLSYAFDFTLRAGTLGGGGELRILTGGKFEWLRDGSVSTQTTRDFNGQGCPKLPNNDPDLSGAPTTPGKTYISKGATLVVDGPTNLYDYRVIENDGTTRLTAGGNIAANHGTRFQNDGTFRIENAGGYYEGWVPDEDTHNCDFDSNGDDEPLSAFVNNGRIVKCPTDTPCVGGTSVIAATYSGAGSVEVHKGVLSIAGSSTAAEVSVGATVSTGSCFGRLCTPTATDTDEHLQSVTMAGTVASAVSITEGGTDGRATIVIPDENADYLTNGKRMTFKFVIDGPVLDGRSVEHGGAGGVDVLHDPDGSGSAPEVALPNCVVQPSPTAAQRACVDRGPSTVTNGDGVLVVRSDHNGRWRPRLGVKL